jgi:predicted SnoaL-like aldol condensation-catalyzing enzyme
MTKSDKGSALEVLKRTFIERDPTVVEQYFGKYCKQHNPVIPDGPSVIAAMIPTLTSLAYEPGMAVGDGELVMVDWRYTGWGPKPMVGGHLPHREAGKVVEHWDVMQEKVPAAETAATPCSHGPPGNAAISAALPRNRRGSAVSGAVMNTSAATIWEANAAMLNARPSSFRSDSFIPLPE